MKTPKYITVDEAIKFVKSNDNVVLGMAGAEPKLFIQKLHEVANEVTGVKVTNCLPIENGEFFINKD